MVSTSDNLMNFRFLPWSKFYQRGFRCVVVSLLSILAEGTRTESVNLLVITNDQAVIPTSSNFCHSFLLEESQLSC
jgi:hypothetical protein